MGFQTWRPEALADLQHILFRPDASLFASNSTGYWKPKSPKTGQFTRVYSNLYSPLARGFLDQKEAQSHEYFRHPTLSTYNGESNARRTRVKGHNCTHGIDKRAATIYKQPKIRLQNGSVAKKIHNEKRYEGTLVRPREATTCDENINKEGPDENEKSVKKLESKADHGNGTTRKFTQEDWARKGELPAKLVKTIWGPTPRKQEGDDEKREAHVEELIRKIRKKKEEAARKTAECLMDVLLKNWIFFEHAHGSLKNSGNDVHAKYCKGAFGHYLLADGTQIHGSYVVSLRQLILQLKGLMAKLKAKLFKSAYKDVPEWKPPRLEALPEFYAPEQPPMPRLYPIEGILPIPEEYIRPDSSMPLLRTPQLKAHPLYAPPKFARRPAAILNIPPLQDFSEEEMMLAQPAKEIPMPTFKMPEILPLPTWVQPQEEPLPSRPTEERIKTFQPLEREVVPPYEAPKLGPRPCEASYYHIEPGQPSICDGLCGRPRGRTSARRGDQDEIPGQDSVPNDLPPCLARPPRLLPSPGPPPDRDVIEEPLFEPPVQERLPPFIPPAINSEPKYVGPPGVVVPHWKPPPPPGPIGYLAGQRPIFLVDCSSTMAGERMASAHAAIRHLFSEGGQVEVAATHFDIIMYSFDAWSFGAVLEEEKQRNLSGGAPHHWVKNLELMQATTPENLEKALVWLSRWKTGGTSNLKKAIEAAMQRTSADCIYLFTHGKCDRPVIIMNTLKELERERRLTPINAVGLEPTKPQARILKNVLADITGGQYIELDMQWRFYSRNEREVREDEDEDARWFRSEMEFWQRKNQSAGAAVRVEVMMDRLKSDFERERMLPRLLMHKKNEERVALEHKVACDKIRDENNRNLRLARDAYENTHQAILELNEKRLRNATEAWGLDVTKVRALNDERRKDFAKWQEKVNMMEEENRKSDEEGRRRFLKEVQRIKEAFADKLNHAKDEHETLVKRLRERSEHMLSMHRGKHEDLVAITKARNEANWKTYEDQCAAVRERNARNAERARREFSEACETLIKENQQRMRDAEADYKWRIEGVTSENNRRKSEHLIKLEDLEKRKLEARTSHHLRVSTMVAEHKASLASIAAVNSSLEQEAKHSWEEACKAVDEENRMITEKAYQDWTNAAHLVQLENEELARKRINLQLRKDEVERMNAEHVRKKKADWKEACLRMEEAYEKDVARARMQYKQSEKELQTRNAHILEAEKASFERNVAQIKEYNYRIRPFVEESALVQREIDKILEFLGYIVSQSHLPPENKQGRKRTLEQSLDMLAALDSPCPPKVLIAALQAAYAKEIEEKMSQEAKGKDKNATDVTQETGIKTGILGRKTLRQQQHQGRFSNMVPIDPPRVSAHYCTAGAKLMEEFENILRRRQTDSEGTMADYSSSKQDLPTGSISFISEGSN